MKISKYFDEILLLILIVNSIFLFHVAFIKTDAMSIEVMKSGGRENFKLVKKLYTHPANILEQKSMIQEWLNAFDVN